MSQVWRGTDLVLGRTVAVKLLDRRALDDPTFVERFRREAQAAARLNHRHIVRIFDSVTESGFSALVLEYVRGSNLRQRMDDGPIDPRRAVAIAVQIAEALEAAHAVGIVHRDIKPANVLLAATDGPDDLDTTVPDVRVTDFGIAKALETAGPQLTRTGTMLGTAKYLAPEQIEGGPVDGRTDVYSLGVVLYEMLTGQVPWQAGSDLATALARMHDEPLPPTRLRPALPPGLEQVVLRALAREPADRFASARAFRDALLAIDTDDTPVAVSLPRVDRRSRVRPPRRTYRRAVTVSAIVIGAVLTAVFLLGLRHRGGGAALPRTSAAAPPTAQAATGAPASEPAPTVLQGVRARSFDPFGDGEENDGLLPLAVDGRTTGDAVWHTECYLGDFSDLPKPGVGLVLDAGSTKQLRGVDLTVRQTGWTAQVFVSDRGADAPAGGGLGPWGAPVATVDGNEAVLHLRFGPVTGRSVLIFFTSIAGVVRDDCFGERPRSRHIDVVEAQLLGS